MTVHPARLAAAAVLGAGAFVVGVAALAIVLAKLLVNDGLPIHPGDLATLNDVVAVIPLVLAFAATSAAAAVGLVVGQAWAERAALGDAIVGIAVGGFGLFLLVVGRDPFATGHGAAAVADGIGILGVFTITYVVVAALLAVARIRTQRPIGGVA